MPGQGREAFSDSSSALRPGNTDEVFTSRAPRCQPLPSPASLFQAQSLTGLSSWQSITKSSCTEAPGALCPPGLSEAGGEHGNRCRGPRAGWGSQRPTRSVHELSVALGPCDDDIHPDAHGLCGRGHHVVQPVMGLHTEGESWVRALGWGGGQGWGSRRPRTPRLPCCLSRPAPGSPGA